MTRVMYSVEDPRTACRQFFYAEFIAVTTKLLPVVGVTRMARNQHDGALVSASMIPRTASASYLGRLRCRSRETAWSNCHENLAHCSALLATAQGMTWTRLSFCQHRAPTEEPAIPVTA